MTREAQAISYRNSLKTFFFSFLLFFTKEYNLYTFINQRAIMSIYKLESIKMVLKVLHHLLHIKQPIWCILQILSIISRILLTVSTNTVNHWKVEFDLVTSDVGFRMTPYVIADAQGYHQNLHSSLSIEY